MSNHAHATVSPATSECPECAGQIAISRTIIRGEVLRCSDCSAELEVTQTAPLVLELAPQVEEDWGE